MSAPRPTGVTVYGCGPDEAALFHALGERHGVVPTIVRADATEHTVERVTGNRCVSVGHHRALDRPALLALHRAGVRYVSTRSVGVDHIDLACARGLGITVGNVAYSPDSVADHTLMTLLMVLRDAKPVLRRADEHDYRLPPRRGRELRDLTVGVVGTGRIGTAVIARLRGFGCQVLTHDRRTTTGAGQLGLDELLRRSDVVTLHVPLDAGNHHLLHRERIARMRPGAVLVNTGRGALVDTDALVAALDSGHLGGVALDVVEGEEGVFYADPGDRAPDRNLRYLQRHPHAVLTPHIAYYTDRALSDAVASSLAGCRAFENRNTPCAG